MITPNPAIPEIPHAPDVDVPLSGSSALPLVLFPVRLETRFFAQTDASYELRVRVYPDKIHMDSHEPELIAEELIWGQHFWEETWRAATDQERAKAAWQQLADRFDPSRAAWVARSLKPLNPGDRPTSPIAPGAPLPKPIHFPSPLTKAEAWLRAPRTQALPSKWMVLGYKDGALVVHVQGAMIPPSLPTGPDPSLTGTDESGFDLGMKWILDFDAAEKVGMGIRVRMTQAAAAAGLDFLLVLGIREDVNTNTDVTALLAELFDAHHYTDGLGFVSPGTPTNNTTDAPSGFSSKDPGHEDSYQAERLASAFQAGDGSNADVLTSALGLGSGAQVFANIPNATQKEQLDARQMNIALWRATWGYFLSQMLDINDRHGNPVTDDDIAWARGHFLDYVRANGPLPTIRVGKQPYGVLPATSLNAWKPLAGQESQPDARLRDFLLKLRDLWRRDYSEVPRLGRSDNIDQDMAEVLSMDGYSSNYSVRPVMGRHYIEHVWLFMSANVFMKPFNPNDWAARKQLIETQFNTWFANQDVLAQPLLQTLGITWRPRLSKAVFSPPVAPLNGPLVQDDPRPDLSPDYIDSLLAARDLGEIRDHKLQTPSPSTLLYLLLRHSMLLEYATAASQLLINRGLLQPIQRREPELVDFDHELSLTVWRQMEEINITVDAEPQPVPVGKYLLGFTPTGEPDVTREPSLKPLSEFRTSLAYLKTLPVAKLEQLLTGTLDLCSHRLDAWITSYATKRLAEIRKTNPAGVLIGGYGWVINLKPADGSHNTVSVPGESTPALELKDNPGFVHTPSLTQATTAALLRSGQLAHVGDQTTSNVLAVDLSSERVRLAIWLLDGVRQGQPLGALLGYRFERRLQEDRKAQYIAPFRELAPLVARKLEEMTGQPKPAESVESIAANNVVDGLALLRRWQNGKRTQPPNWNPNTIPFGHAVGNQSQILPPYDPNHPDPDYELLQHELAILEDSVDAVSDALLAESVHQIVRGNPLRAAATLEAIAGGETPPPELDVVRTPRTGIAFTHRLVTFCSGGLTLPAEWTSSPNPFRADAEPQLNAWVAKLLGNPSKVRCVVERLEPETGEVLESKDIRLDQLSLTPLDYVYAAEGGQTGQQAEIEQRILYRMVRKADGFPPGSSLRIHSDRTPDWKVDDLSYGEFSELLRSVRKLLSGVRAIDGDDLSLPEQTVNMTVDLVDLENRAATAAQSLRGIVNEFQARLANSDQVNLDFVREAIFRAASFGVAGAIPLSSAGSSDQDRQTIFVQARSIHKELAQRQEQLSLLIDGFHAATATPEEKRDHALACLRTIFGKAFLVLPHFTAENADELEQALANSTKLQDDDPLAVVTWFERMARVRDGFARLNKVLSYAEALGREERVKLAIAQLPHNADDRWVGLPLLEGRSLPGGKLSLVVQSAPPIDVHQPIAGLLIDEWVEVVPSPVETTGITFQYDQPNSAPPQTILIAVPPEVGMPWTLWSLQQVLLETLDLARIRAVDPDALDEVGQYLPALYFAFNSSNDGAVSTDFTMIK
jgi:hypothetical protein